MTARWPIISAGRDCRGVGSTKMKILRMKALSEPLTRKYQNENIKNYYLLHSRLSLLSTIRLSRNNGVNKRSLGQGRSVTLRQPPLSCFERLRCNSLQKSLNNRTKCWIENFRSQWTCAFHQPGQHWGNPALQGHQGKSGGGGIKHPYFGRFINPI